MPVYYVAIPRWPHQKSHPNEIEILKGILSERFHIISSTKLIVGIYLKENYASGLGHENDYTGLHSIAQVNLTGPSHTYQITNSSPAKLKVNNSSAIEVINIEYYTNDELSEEFVQQRAQEMRGVEQLAIIINDDRVEKKDDEHSSLIRASLPKRNYYGNFTLTVVRDLVGTRYYSFSYPVLVNFIKGMGLGIEIVWPLIMSGLLVSDLTFFYAQRDNRYGNTLSKILLGTSTNLESLGSNLGNNLPTESLFWIWPSFLASIPLTTGILNMIYQSCIGRSVIIDYAQCSSIQLGKEVDKRKVDALKELETRTQFVWSKIPQFIISHYQLWSLGYGQKYTANIVMQPFFWFFNLSLWYGGARVLELIIFKLIAAFNYFQDKDSCVSKQQIYIYLAEYANYLCTICGNWPFVYYGNVGNAQECLNALLKSGLTPEEINIKLQQILPHLKKIDIDLSQANWGNWTQSQFQNLLSSFVSVAELMVGAANFSSPTYDPISDGSEKISLIKQFMISKPVERLLIAKRGLGPQLMSQLAPAFNGSSLKEIDVSDDNLGDEGFLEVLAGMNETAVETLIVKDNQITDNAVSGLSDTSIQNLKLSGNSFGQNLINTVAGMIARNQLKSIDLSDIDLSALNLLPLWQASSNSTSLESVKMSNCNFNGQQIELLSPFLKKMSVKSYDFSNNSIGDQDAGLIFQGLQAANTTHINLNNNNISDYGLAIVAGIFPATNITDLHLDMNAFSSIGGGQLFSNLPNRPLSLSMANNGLGDDIGIVFEEAANNRTLNIDKFDLSNNQMSSKGGIPLATSVIRANIKSLVLIGNFLDDAFAEKIASVLPHSLLSSMDLTGNSIGLNGIRAISGNLSESPLEKFFIGNNPCGDEGASDVIDQLITPVPHLLEDGGIEISEDEMRAIRQANPNTNLTVLGIANTNMTTSTARRACRFINSTRINMYDYNAIPNAAVDNNYVNLLNCHISSASTLQPFIMFKVLAKIFGIARAWLGRDISKIEMVWFLNYRMPSAEVRYNPLLLGCNDPGSVKEKVETNKINDNCNDYDVDDELYFDDHQQMRVKNNYNCQSIPEFNSDRISDSFPSQSLRLSGSYSGGHNNDHSAAALMLGGVIPIVAAIIFLYLLWCLLSPLIKNMAVKLSDCIHSRDKWKRSFIFNNKSDKQLTVVQRLPQNDSIATTSLTLTTNKSSYAAQKNFGLKIFDTLIRNKKKNETGSQGQTLVPLARQNI